MKENIPLFKRKYVEFIIQTSYSSLTYKNIRENRKHKFKREHDPEDSEHEAVIKDSTKSNLAYSIVLLIFQVRVKHSGCIMFSSFD